MFPFYSLLQDDLPGFRRAYVQNLQRICLLAAPMSIALGITAEPIVLGLLGEEWSRVVTPMRVMAGSMLIASLAAPCVDVFKGLGVPHLALAFSVVQAALVVPALLILTPRYGLTGAATAVLASQFGSSLPAIGVVMRRLRLRVGELVRALAPAALCSALLALTLALLLPAMETASPRVAVTVIIPAGLAVYVAATMVFARSVLAPVWLGLRGIRS